MQKKIYVYDENLIFKSENFLISDDEADFDEDKLPEGVSFKKYIGVFQADKNKQFTGSILVSPEYKLGELETLQPAEDENGAGYQTDEPIILQDDGTWKGTTHEEWLVEHPMPDPTPSETDEALNFLGQQVAMLMANQSDGGAE